MADGAAPRRFSSVIELVPELEARYRELHREAWPGVLRRLRECGVRNYSIYVAELAGRRYLFSYLEYVGDSYERDMARIGEDETTRRWWAETDPCQRPLPAAEAAGRRWLPVEEVFHTD